VAAKRQMNVRLTDNSRRGWDREVRRHQVDLTALAEAIGLAFDERTLDLPAEIIEAAQQIKWERNNPGPRR
jgi:hypothetical protein